MFTTTHRDTIAALPATPGTSAQTMPVVRLALCIARADVHVLCGFEFSDGVRLTGVWTAVHQS
jgi:hypothetical protein